MLGPQGGVGKVFGPLPGPPRDAVFGLFHRGLFRQGLPGRGLFASQVAEVVGGGAEVVPHVGNHVVGALHYDGVPECRAQAADVLGVVQAGPFQARAAEAHRLEEGHGGEVPLAAHLPRDALEYGARPGGGGFEGQGVVMVVVHHPAFVDAVVQTVIVHHEDKAVGFEVPGIPQRTGVIGVDGSEAVHEEGDERIGIFGRALGGQQP